MSETDPNILSAFIGAFVAVVTIAIKYGIDLAVHRLSTRKRLSYLCIRLSMKLDRFIIGCADVVSDDGLRWGQTDIDGQRREQVEDPAFDLESLDVEWRVMQPEDLDRVLHLPVKIDRLRAFLRAVQYESTPPEHPEYFDARRNGYGNLGLEAYDLLVTLRKRAKLPAPVMPDWDPINKIETTLASLEEAQSRHRESQKRAFAQLKSLGEEP